MKEKLLPEVLQPFKRRKAFSLIKLKAFLIFGTPRFELGASPTPRVRATRLRHVP